MSANVDLVNDRIELRFGYSAEGVARAKSVPGARWNADGKFWSYAKDMQTCRLLREAFGKSLKIGPALSEWAWAQKDRDAEIKSVATLDLTKPVELENVPTLNPQLWEAMQRKGYQPSAVKFVTLVRNAIIGDSPGLGKTVETFGSLIESRTTGRILVVAPKTSLRATWEPEVTKWLSTYQDGATMCVVDASVGGVVHREEALAAYIAREPMPGEMSILAVNPEMLRAKRKPGEAVEFAYPIFNKIAWDAVVVDESHRYLLNANPRSKSCSQWGLGLAYLNIAKNGQRIALSGTPMKGRPRKIWHTLRWLCPEKYTSEWAWSKRYFQTEYDRWSPNGEKITDKLKPEMEQAFYEELSQVMIRRTKPELRKINPAWAPPDKEYFEVWLPMGAKQEKLYKAMERDAEATMDGQVLMANGVLAILTRLKQFATSAGRMEDGTFYPAAPSNKIEWLMDDFIPGREGKIVIASQFSKVVDLVSAELTKAKIDNFKLTGEVKDADRAAMIARFQQDGGPQVFCLTTTAGGVSITLDAADDLVLLDETWVPDDQEQVEDRIHRTSNVEHQVNIYYVRSLGTVEQDIAETVEAKDTSQKRVLDGRRGVEYAKRKFRVEVK